MFTFAFCLVMTCVHFLDVCLDTPCRLFLGFFILTCLLFIVWALFCHAVVLCAALGIRLDIVSLGGDLACFSVMHGCLDVRCQ